MELFKMKAWRLAVLTVLMSAGVLGAAPGKSDIRIAPPDSNPYGKSYSEWGAEWWQWAISFPLDESPVTDPTGDLAHLGQSGKVWFLAGTFGGSVERTVTIPKGKALFFPIVNVIGVFMPEPGEEVPTEEELQEFLDFVMSSGVTAHCTIDGVTVADLDTYRGQTGFFSVSVPANGLVDEGVWDLSISDGLYLMLKPLKAGEGSSVSETSPAISRRRPVAFSTSAAMSSR